MVSSLLVLSPRKMTLFTSAKVGRRLARMLESARCGGAPQMEEVCFEACSLLWCQHGNAVSAPVKNRSLDRQLHGRRLSVTRGKEEPCQLCTECCLQCRRSPTKIPSQPFQDGGIATIQTTRVEGRNRPKPHWHKRPEIEATPAKVPIIDMHNCLHSQRIE